VISLQQLRAYTIKHEKGDVIASFINDYVRLLHETVDRIWSRSEWLDKQSMYTYGRSHNRKLSKSDWKMMQRFLAYKTGWPIGLLNPYNSTRRCSRCGEVNKAQNGSSIIECQCCGLRINRQLNAAVNLHFQMEGLPPSPKLFDELMKAWIGFTQTGEKPGERTNELERFAMVMNPQSYGCLHLTISSEPYSDSY
jgi:hypothetical protein